RLPLADRRLAVQDEARAAEERSKERRKRCGHLAELREDEHFLLLRGDDLRYLAQSGQLAAVGLTPRSIAEPLRRMIADLLEAHQRCEHDAPTLHPVSSLQFSR